LARPASGDAFGEALGDAAMACTLTPVAWGSLCDRCRVGGGAAMMELPLAVGADPCQPVAPERVLGAGEEFLEE